MQVFDEIIKELARIQSDGSPSGAGFRKKHPLSDIIFLRIIERTIYDIESPVY